MRALPLLDDRSGERGSDCSKQGRPVVSRKQTGRVGRSASGGGRGGRSCGMRRASRPIMRPNAPSAPGCARAGTGAHAPLASRGEGPAPVARPAEASGRSWARAPTHGEGRARFNRQRSGTACDTDRGTHAEHSGTADAWSESGTTAVQPCTHARDSARLVRCGLVTDSIAYSVAPCAACATWSVRCSPASVAPDVERGSRGHGSRVLPSQYNRCHHVWYRVMHVAGDDALRLQDRPSPVQSEDFPKKPRVHSDDQVSFHHRHQVVPSPCVPAVGSDTGGWPGGGGGRPQRLDGRHSTSSILPAVGSPYPAKKRDEHACRHRSDSI